MTIPCNFAMLIAFLFELSLFDQKTRVKIFKGELSKMFFSILGFYFVAIIYVHWVQGLITFSQKNFKVLSVYKKEKEEIKERYKKDLDWGNLKYHMNMLNRPLVYIAKGRQEEFQLAWFEPTELIDYLYDIVDVYVGEKCPHFFDDDFNPYLDVMRNIQTTAALVFFTMIHIPLCRVHSLFTLLTGFLPLMLNLRTKVWFYEKANQWTAWAWLSVFRKDVGVINNIKKRKEMIYKEHAARN